MKDFQVIRRQNLLALLLLAFSALTTGSAWAQLKPGAVVEKVTKDSEAKKAGLQESDLLLSWSRDSTQGEIQSPFDLSKIEIEEAPRGNVTLSGLRGTEARTWTLGPSSWGLTTRPNLPEALLVIYREGQDLAKAGKPKQAAERWREAASQVDGSQPTWLRAWFLLHVAVVLADAQQWKEAEDSYQQAVQRAAESGSQVHQQVLQAWADAYFQRGEMLSAEKYYQQALAENQRLGTENLQTVLFLNSLGEVTRVHDLAAGESYLLRALTIAKRLAPNSLPVSNSLLRLGSVATRRGDLALAEDYLNQGLVIKEKLAPGSLTVANTLHNLGIVAWMQGDLAKSDEYYRQALALREKLAPGNSRVAETLQNLGNNAFERGELTKAEQYDRQALAIKEKGMPNSLEAAHTLESLGNVAYARDDLAAAEDYYSRSLTIKQKLGASMDIADTLANLGAVAQERGDPAKAEQYFLQSLKIIQENSPGSYYVADGLDSLGQLAKDRGDLAKAEQYFRQSLAMKEKMSPGSLRAAASLNYLADVARDRGDMITAEEQYRQALAIREKQAPGSADHAESLAALAGVLRRRRKLDDAAQYYQQALTAFENQTARLGGSEETRSSFRAKYASYYKDYIDLLIAQGKFETAFNVLERLRARSLLETLALARADIRKGVDPALVERERSLQESISAKSARRIELLNGKHTDEQLAAFDKEIKGLLTQYQDLEEHIRVNSPSYAALTQPQPLSAKEVQQQLLDADTLLLEYSLGEGRSHVFAVTQDSLNAYELPKRTEIERVAQQVCKLLTERNNKIKGETEQQKHARLIKAETEYSRALATLSGMVLGPVAAQLQRKRLLIVSDGGLQFIPFAVLLTSEKGVPLIADHEIVNSPSVSVLAVLRHEEMERKPAPKAVAVLADPVFTNTDDRLQLASLKNQPPSGVLNPKPSSNSSTSQAAELDAAPDDGRGDLNRSAAETGVSDDGVFSRLPFTRREAEAIQSVGQPGEVTEALDFDASKATALGPELKNYRIVHFATHGLLNNDHPELSGLVFSLVDKQGQSQDGFLRMLDIYNMELNADLVVLSACQTALGKQIQEEGLLGLTRGFMYAGAPRVVASLWKVDDEATAELMKKFYEGMLRDHQTPARALRSAQLWMRTQKAWQSPYYWAGFVLQGEWK